MTAATPEERAAEICTCGHRRGWHDGDKGGCEAWPMCRPLCNAFVLAPADQWSPRAEPVATPEERAAALVRVEPSASVALMQSAVAREIRAAVDAERERCVAAAMATARFASKQRAKFTDDARGFDKWGLALDAANDIADAIRGGDAGGGE